MELLQESVESAAWLVAHPALPYGPVIGPNRGPRGARRRALAGGSACTHGALLGPAKEQKAAGT